MSLFLKIFLWFWLATALVIAALTLATWTTQTEPLVRQWQANATEATILQVGTAVQIFDAEGKKGLDEYLKRLQDSQKLLSVGFFSEDGEQISGEKFSIATENIFRKALESETVEFDRSSERTLTAKKATLETGETVVLIRQWERPRLPGFFSQPWTQILRVLAVILTAGLVCFALAKYLTAPVVKLRRATQKFADGDLQTRVGAKVGRGRDELSRLAKDFDEMAERIELLITSEKRLTQDISHELRSPLARLNVALELARSKANAETKPFFERIETESSRLNEMISRLLMLSKLETGSENFEKRETNLTKLFEQVAADADFEAQGKGKKVKVAQKGDVKIFGNESLLRSAIENVLRNAVRYTKEATTVEVSLKRENGKAVIIIKDYGDGVPDAEIENLFRPFYRVQTARDRKSGGIGLGLAIAERAVSVHDGTIAAKNTENGLVVEITLPATAAR